MKVEIVRCARCPAQSQDGKAFAVAAAGSLSLGEGASATLSGASVAASGGHLVAGVFHGALALRHDCSELYLNLMAERLAPDRQAHPLLIIAGGREISLSRFKVRSMNYRMSSCAGPHLALPP